MTIADEKGVASVTVDGETTSYGSIAEAWQAAKRKSATIELNFSVTEKLTEPLVVEDGDDITITKSSNDTISFTDIEANGDAIIVNGGNLTIENELLNIQSNGEMVSGFCSNRESHN